MKKKIAIINGPNMNLLGRREPHIYGTTTMEDCLTALRQTFADIEISYFQSNSEGALIDQLQKEAEECCGIVLNAAAYSHTSLALLDCLRAIDKPVVEVHLSNIHARETMRHESITAAGCKGVVCGFGTDGYRLAIEALLAL